MKRRDGRFWFVFLTLVLAAGVHSGISASTERNGITRHEWSTPLSSLKVELKGEIEFTSDDSDIASLSPGGYLEIAERSGFVTHHLRIEPAGDGGLEYDYRRGSKKTFDDDARAWFAEVLPRVIREAGIGAEGRVRRILESEGVSGVLEEIDRIESSSATSTYCMELLEHDLDETELARLSRAAVSGIRSSGDRARFMIAASEHYLVDAGSADAYFDATASIPSSGDHARVLMHVIDDGRADDPTVLAALLRSARGIESSGDKAKVLVAASHIFVEDDLVRSRFFEAADSIPSSGDHARVLLELLEKDALSSPTLAGVFESARGIESSGDKARVLIAGAEKYADEQPVRRAYFDTVDSVPSSGDYARVLVSLLNDAELDQPGLIALLKSARGIASSGDKTRVLLVAADHVEDELAMEVYLSTAETIASSGDQARALKALIR